MRAIGCVSAILCVVACTSRPEPRAIEPAPVTPAAVPVSVASVPDAAIAQDAAIVPVATPSANGDLIVVARVTDAGPIGDGRCSQRSYEVAIDRVVAGTVDAPKDKRWVHFEQCGAARQPAPAGDLAGTGLAVGSTYQLTLRAGASPNFGNGLMILAARAP